MSAGPTVCTFTVAGVAVAQGSKTVVRAGAYHRAIESNDRNLRPWRQAVATAARAAMDIGDPVRVAVGVTLEFTAPRPRSHYGTGRNEGHVRKGAPAARTTAPDLDKLCRSVLDSLTGIVLVDDSQVVELNARKGYGPAGVTVHVWEYEPDTLDA